MFRIPSYLLRHPDSGVLYYRFQVPERLQGAIGKRTIKRSLQTCDRRQAIPVALSLHLETLSLIQKIEKEMASQRPPSKQSVLDELENMPAPPDGSAVPKITLEIGGSTVIIEGKTPEEEAAIARNLLPAPSKAEPASIPTGGNADSEKLLKVAELYRNEKVKEGSWTPETLNEQRATHELLVEIVGNLPVAAISFKEARLFKATLQKLPANRGKLVKYKGKTAKQLAAMNIPARELPHLRTVNEKIQRISSLFLWAIRNGYTEQNPFEGQKFRLAKGKASEERAAFSADDLRAIFNPERFNRDKLRHPFKFWCPLLALFTGARAQEVAQLRVQDVFEENGVWAIRITKAAGRLKTVSSEREIPLHNDLIGRGFLEFVAKVKEAKQERLFPEAWDTKNGPGDKLSRWFAVYRKGMKIGQAKKGDGQPVKCLHSFRHNFADGLKQAGADPLKISQLLGHADENISTGRYGKAYPLKSLCEVVSLLDFGI